MKMMKAIATLIVIFGFSFAGKLYSQDTTRSTNPADTSFQALEMKLEQLSKQIEVLADSLERKVNQEIKPRLSEAIQGMIDELQREIEELQRDIGGKSDAGKEEQRSRSAEDEIEDGDGDKDSSWIDVLDGIDISFKKKKEKLSDKKTRWFLFDLGFATYQSENPLPKPDGISPMEMDLMKSISWRLHLFNQRINISNHRLNFIYGAGFTFNAFGFSNPVTLVPSSREVVFEIDDENSRNYNKNKLRATYLHIPVKLNFESKPYSKKNSLRINAGFYGDVMLKGKMVQKINKSKNKVKDDFNLNNFQYGLLGEIGYGAVNFYGTYGLNGLFKEDKDNGYSVRPVTVGVKIIPF